MQDCVIVGAASFVVGVGVSFAFWRKPAVVRRVLAPGKYKIVRSDGIVVHSSDDEREARRVYMQTELRRGEHVEFYDDDKWRGKRTP